MTFTKKYWKIKTVLSVRSYTNKSQWLLRFTPPYVYVKVLEEGIQYLKKDKVNENLDLAVKILTLLIKQNTFRQHKKAGWFSEKALIVDKLLLWPDEVRHRSIYIIN